MHEQESDPGRPDGRVRSGKDIDPILRNFLDRAPMPAWYVDGECDLLHANAAWLDFAGADLDRERGQGWLDHVIPEDRVEVRNACVDAMGTDRAASAEVQVRRADGQSRWLTCFVSPYVGEDGVPEGVAGLCMDLTERRQREEQLAYMATHDSLTGLPNRRMFEAALDRSVKRARRGETSALLLLDLDNFKSYNDALGHLEGDQALINFALLLQRHVRAGDLLARIGGDEFAVLLERTSLAEAIDVAERMRRASWEEDFVMAARMHELGISAGLVPVEGGLDSRALFDVADAAMYEAKEAGRNRVVVRKTSAEETGADTERLATRVRDALANERFQLYYQPVVRLDGRGVAYYESLVRMVDPDGEVHLPAEFLATVGRLGLMPRLTRQVIGMLTRELAEHPEAVVSMNVSAGDLAEDALPRFLEEELRRLDLDPSRLVLEIAENSVVANLTGTRNWMRRLHGLGCRFVLDEFGAGLGLFGLLRELDFEQVKLDGTIVRELSDDGHSRDFVAAVRSLVESQGCVAVASWVETERMLDRIREIGFELGQGYGLQMPEPDLGRLLARYRRT